MGFHTEAAIVGLIIARSSNPDDALRSSHRSVLPASPVVEIFLGALCVSSLRSLRLKAFFHLSVSCPIRRKSYPNRVARITVVRAIARVSGENSKEAKLSAADSENTSHRLIN
jgi:hypothetical protein